MDIARRVVSSLRNCPGSDFQLACWRALAEIQYGETRSYGEQARRLGRPDRARAVGAANGANPIAIILPCHRVWRSDGGLGGYIFGADVKDRLAAEVPLHGAHRRDPGLQVSGRILAKKRRWQGQ